MSKKECKTCEYVFKDNLESVNNCCDCHNNCNYKEHELKGFCDYMARKDIQNRR